MNRFDFLHLDSPIHRLHPLIKLLVCFLFLITATVIYDPLPNMVLFAYTLIIAIVIASIPARGYLKALLPFSFIAVGFFVSQVLFRGSGTPIFSIGPFDVTVEATRYGLALGFRMLTVISISLIFAMTTDPKEFALSLIQQLRVSYRVAWALFYALRMVPQSQSELAIIRSAQRIRGVGEKPGLLGLLREYKRFTLPLLVSLIRKTDRAAIAMESKAFGAYPQRTYLDHVFIRGIDVAILIAITVILGVTMYALWELELLQRVTLSTQTVPD